MSITLKSVKNFSFHVDNNMMSKYVLVLLCAAFMTACKPSDTTTLNKADQVGEAPMSTKYPWLANPRWTPRQTGKAVEFFRDSYYHKPEVVEMMIVEKLASEGHLDAMYALQTSKMVVDLNDPDFSYTDEDKYQDGKVYYKLAEQGQMNAKWHVIDWYTDRAYDELDTKIYYEALKEFSNHQSDEFLKEMINDYYYELVMAKADDKGLLGGYIDFIASNQSYKSQDNYFNRGDSYYHADLRNFQALKNPKVAGEFFNVFDHYFEQSHDPELLPYLTQLYAFGIGTTKDLKKACEYFAYAKDDTEFMQTSPVVDDLITLFDAHNIKCHKNPNIKVATPEEANEWYQSIFWGERYDAEY